MAATLPSCQAQGQRPLPSGSSQKSSLVAQLVNDPVLSWLGLLLWCRFHPKKKKKKVSLGGPLMAQQK